MGNVNHISRLDMEHTFAAIERAGVRFPEVIVVDEVEGGGDIVAYEKPSGDLVYYLRDGDGALDALLAEINSPSARRLPAPAFHNHSLSSEEMRAWVRCVRAVAGLLHIECPQILFTQSDYGSQASSTGDGFIWLPESPLGSYWKVVEALVQVGHELRHEWQHLTYPEWFEDYVLPEVDFEAYRYHPAEIDAEAWGRTLAGAVVGRDLIVGPDEDYVRTLRARSEQIDLDEEAVDRADIARILGIPSLAR